MSAATPSTTIAVIEDDSALRRALRTSLRARGFDVLEVATGAEAIVIAADGAAELLLLDLGLPDLDGIEVLTRVREFSAVPIVVLTARDRQSDKVRALDAGADDYVAKPFGVGELMARVRAALRRAAPADEVPVIVTPDLTIDLAARTVVTRRGESKLTPTEWHVVEVLVRNAGRLVTGRDLLQQVWGPQYSDETNYLRVHMAHIRRKLEPEAGTPQYFHTEPGMGYRFQPPGHQADAVEGDR
jgi:two-component system KDP operon response regulator KdpE